MSIIKTSRVPMFAFVATFLLTPSVRAELLVELDFESLAPGDGVEGLGAVHELLDISAGGESVVLGEGIAYPSTYGGGLGNRPNGCLGNPGAYSRGEAPQYGQGFADATRQHDYLFSFAPGTTVSEFSLTMLDFGDLNPSLSAQHEVRLSAFDAEGALVDEHVLAYVSTPQFNPPEYRYVGDACYALPGQLGNYTFAVAGSGIVWVVLEVRSGLDPNIAFDDIAFTACTDLDEDGVCDDCDACPDTAIPEMDAVEIGTHRYALIDEDGVFETLLPGGTIADSSYTLADTQGCSCEQVVEQCGVGKGHERGCSKGIMDVAIAGGCGFEQLCEL